MRRTRARTSELSKSDTSSIFDATGIKMHGCQRELDLSRHGYESHFLVEHSKHITNVFEGN